MCTVGAGEVAELRERVAWLEMVVRLQGHQLRIDRDETARLSDRVARLERDTTGCALATNSWRGRPSGRRPRSAAGRRAAAATMMTVMVVAASVSGRVVGRARRTAPGRTVAGRSMWIGS